MPIYEYECAQCEKVFDQIQKFSDAPLEKCPTCGSPVKKLMSLSAFSLKGEGWYVTDYKKSKKSESNAAVETKKTEKTVSSKSDD